VSKEYVKPSESVKRDGPRNTTILWSKSDRKRHDVDGDRATVVVGEAEVVMGRLHLHAIPFLLPLTELHRAHFVPRSRKRSRSLR